jgi:hypothetical protein
MYIYFDESIISIEKEKYVTVGCIAYEKELKNNLILKEFSKTRSTLKNKKEIKFSNVRNHALRNKILEKIKKESIFYFTETLKLENSKDIHDNINLAMTNSLVSFSKKIFCTNLIIIYDKSTYKINAKDMKKEFNFIKEIKLKNSTVFAGLQHADWIAGDASLDFKNLRSENKQ